MLKSELPAKESNKIIYKDVDGDNDPDILEAWWNGKRCRWFDENDNMTEKDRRGDIFGDSLQVDMDGDGSYDGVDDMNIVWVDSDGDEMADLMTVAVNPSAKQMESQSIKTAGSHYMHFVDIDKDGVNHYIDWNKWSQFRGGAWRHTGGCNFSPDYNGNSIYMKAHFPPWGIKDPRYNWENPFLFYDFDDDGCTEMTVRVGSSKINETKMSTEYIGEISNFKIGLDLDNDSQIGREFSFDMSIQFGLGKESAKIDYSEAHSFPGLKAPEWVLSYYQYTNYREIDELIYTSHDSAYDIAMNKQDWGDCRIQFDEDGDDHRWERVFLYEEGDPYEPRSAGKPSLVRGPSCDSLGDRMENDSDFSGGGKLYIGPWDQKLHLYGAETGIWMVDDGSYFSDSGNVPPLSPQKDAPGPGEIVQYQDTDEDGVFDRITYDYDGDREIDLSVDLKQYNLPPPELLSLGELEWEGLHETFNAIAKQSWSDAQLLYRAAWRVGLNDAELDELAIASSTWEKYDHGYWLKAKLFRKLYAEYQGNKQAELVKLYFTGDFKALAAMITK